MSPAWIKKKSILEWSQIANSFSVGRPSFSSVPNRFATSSFLKTLCCFHATQTTTKLSRYLQVEIIKYKFHIFVILNHRSTEHHERWALVRGDLTAQCPASFWEAWKIVAILWGARLSTTHQLPGSLSSIRDPLGGPLLPQRALFSLKLQLLITVF